MDVFKNMSEINLFFLPFAMIKLAQRQIMATALGSKRNMVCIGGLVLEIRDGKPCIDIS